VHLGGAALAWRWEGAAGGGLWAMQSPRQEEYASTSGRPPGQDLPAREVPGPYSGGITVGEAAICFR
jgi:hypothetical protein